MSRYLARLKALITEDARSRPTDETDKSSCVSFVSDQGSPLCADDSTIEERAALAAGQRPSYVEEEAWRRATDDAGRLLDTWGADAAAMRWTAGELFDVPREGRPGGLVWQLKGERVEPLGEARAQLTDGRTIGRG